MELIDILVFALGAAMVGGTILSAVRTVVVPHGGSSLLSSAFFIGIYRLVSLHERLPGGQRRRHGVLSMFAPVTLISLPLLWLTCALGGFTVMFWALGTHPLRQAFRLAGSSMLTLGWVEVGDLPRTLLAFFSLGTGHLGAGPAARDLPPDDVTGLFVAGVHADQPRDLRR